MSLISMKVGSDFQSPSEILAERPLQQKPGRFAEACSLDGVVLRLIAAGRLLPGDRLVGNMNFKCNLNSLSGSASNSHPVRPL